MEENQQIHKIGQDEHIEFTRPDVLQGYTRKLNAPCGDFFLTLNEHESHLAEVRMVLGKCGSCTNILLSMIAILISKLLQEGVRKDDIKKLLFHQFEGSCGNVMYSDGEKYFSCIDFATEKILEDMASRGDIDLE
jgi:hypothetical protein